MAKFPESRIRGIAERLWWHAPPQKHRKQTLAKYNYLTEEQVDELQSTPEYRAYVEQIMFERRSDEDFEKWVESYDRVGGIETAFGARIGLKPEVVQEMVARVRQARREKKNI